ncbi:MAG: hypothetical protein JSU70_01165 [Phycisphaerales bacterium]|nr:MAG: hypothetical protein JSU70_01165 [Phycisphaerales bacterium]
MIFYVLHIGSALALLVSGGIVMLRKKTPGLWGCFLMGWAWQVLLSLPAGIWQTVKGWPHISVSGSPLHRFVTTALVGWPFNTGGYTVRWVFEATVERLECLVGHRSAVVFSNMPYYLFLVAVQASIIALIFALRYKRDKTLADWPVISLAILFLINSLANVRWFWAGT